MEIEMRRPKYNTYKTHPAFHPITVASVMMSDEVWKSFFQSIKTIGQLVPIVRFDGLIIDGRSRYLACVELGLEPIYVESTAQTTSQAMKHSCAYNVLHYRGTEDQRAVSGACLMELDEQGIISLEEMYEGDE